MINVPKREQQEDSSCTFVVAAGWAAKLLTVGLFLGLGISFYTQELAAAEALYFSVVTISTVGYGDYSPEDTGSRLFTFVYMLLGKILCEAAAHNGGGCIRMIRLLLSTTNQCTAFIRTSDPTARLLCILTTLCSLCSAHCATSCYLVD